MATPYATLVEALAEEVEDLCQIHDHITRIIANVDIPVELFSDYANPEDADFTLESVIRMCLYKEARDFGQSETVRRLRGAAYIYIKFDLVRPPTQAGLSHMWKERFTLQERRFIKAAAARIREVCEEHDVVDQHEPVVDPEDIHGKDIGEEQVVEAVERATELGFAEFEDPRAPNWTYPLEAYFERQGYLNFAKAGTSTESYLFSLISDREDVQCGSSHNRTLKKIADPDRQVDLWDFVDGRGPADWKRIRDAVLPAFHAGVEKQLDEIAGRDRQGIRQPVHAAIDIVTFNHWPSPLKDDEDIDPGEEPVQTKHGEVYPREDFPEMVSGFKKNNKNQTDRGYKFATITIVAEDTPIILGIEPVRDYRWWERPDREDVETTSRGGIVDRLLEQAEQHVDINKVFCDREFDSFEVRDAIDSRTIQYVNGKQKRSNADYENIEEIIEDPAYDTRIEHAWQTHEGRRHKVSIVYLPGGEYSLFTMNGWVDPDRADALAEQYRERWTIENQYKSLRQNFLPRTASKDYRNRFLVFTVAVILHNVWRLTNFMLRDEVDVNLGESPPVPGREVVGMVGMWLFDPGG